MMPFVLSGRTIKDVLLQYDGPQLVALEEGDRLFLALAVDEDQDAVRWIQAPTSALELDAVRNGAEPVRQAFLKSRVTVVDVQRASFVPVAAWDVAVADIPDTVLPERGARMPMDRRQLTAADHPPAFRLAGRTAPGNRVAFGDLSAFTSHIQGLWNAFAEQFNAGLQTLSAVGIESGSLRVVVHTDNVALFKRIASQYQELVSVTDDPDRLREALANVPSRVAHSYAEYIRTLQRHDVEVLCEWSDGGAFISSQIVERVIDSLPALLQGEQLPTAEETGRFRGYFEGFYRGERGRFEFYDLDSAQTYRGQLDPTLRHKAVPDFSLTLGRLAMEQYVVQVRITRRPEGATRYTLLDFQRVSTRSE